MKKKYAFKRFRTILVFILTFSQFVNFSFSAESTRNDASIQPAAVHPLESRYLPAFISFCSQKGIRSKMIPAMQNGRRILFSVFENDPDTENLVASVKIISARYLLPLMREMLVKRINEPGYVLLLINLKGTNKMLTATVLPSEAILFTAGRITQERFLSRVKISFTNL